MVVHFGYGLDLKSEGYGRCLQLTLDQNPMSIRGQSTFYDIDPKLIFI